MKTVMKKMFSLMLVAVLMVGMMPLQASADELVPAIQIIVNVDGTNVTVFQSSAADASGTMQLGAWQSEAESRTPNATFVNWTWSDDSPVAGNELIGDKWIIIANFTENSCPTCGQKLSACDCCDECGAANGAAHNAGCPNAPQPATYTLTLQLRLGETSKDIVATKSKSGLKGDINLKAISEELFPTYTYLWTQLGKGVDTMTIDQDTTLIVRMSAPVVTNTCSICGETYVNGTTHTCPTCSDISGCVLTKNHSGEHQCACGLYPQAGSGHNTSCPYYEANNKTYSLKVWAKLWVGNSLNNTILLDEFTELDGTEVVPYIIGNNVSRLESKFPSGYNNIEWTKAVYYYIDSNTTGTVDTNMNVNEEDNVYINLYSQEKLFVVNVHLGKYYGIDSTVKVGGFRVGETVSYDDVLKAVKKQYNVSSMKMYTYDNWCKVVEGKDSSTSPYFQVHNGDNVYEVYVSGSRKTSSSSSSSATADSSNPKTGDMIFAPVAVMGLSVSALAVLFFLNKKRAY